MQIGRSSVICGDGLSDMCILFGNISLWKTTAFSRAFETYFGQSGSAIPHTVKYGISIKTISKNEYRGIMVLVVIGIRILFQLQHSLQIRI
jgi:hypothetical protein